MPNTVTAQDARRELALTLVERIINVGIERGYDEASYINPRAERRFNAQKKACFDALYAALRAEPARGAEEMRERAASEAERCVQVPYKQPGGGTGHRLPMAPRTPREIAAAIRALPLPQGNEGGGE